MKKILDIYQKDIKRFAIHKNYGIDINGKKRKAEYYQLIEKIGNRTNIIMQVFPSQYSPALHDAIQELPCR